MSPSDTPAVLLVHGGWHLPDPHYKRLTDQLQAAGFVVSAPRLPSVSGIRPPTCQLSDDVNCVQEEALKLADAGHPILVICHSYGGLLSTEAFTQDLSFKSRREAGKRGGVARIIYMCAFMPQVGDTIQTIEQNTKGKKTILNIVPDAEMMTMPSNPDCFYNDLTEETIDIFTKALVMVPAPPLMSPATHLAWKHVPTTYIYCENDLALPVNSQKQMVDAVEAQGISVQTETLSGSHSVFESQAEGVVGCVQRAWEATKPEVASEA